MTHLWSSLSLCRLFGPHGLILYFYVPRSSPKITCLYLYVTFKAILACKHILWPQTCIHRDVCIKTNIFGVFLIWIRIYCLLAFHVPWECSYSTIHYLFGVLYKEPLGYIKGGEIEEQVKYSPLLIQLCLYLSMHPFVPWSTWYSSQDFLFLWDWYR